MFPDFYPETVLPTVLQYTLLVVPFNVLTANFEHVIALYRGFSSSFLVLILHLFEVLM